MKFNRVKLENAVDKIDALFSGVFAKTQIGNKEKTFIFYQRAE